MSSLLNRVIAHYSSHRNPQDAPLTCTCAGAGSVCRSRWSQRITQIALAVALGLGGSGAPLFLPSPAAPAAHAESVFEHRFDPSHPIVDKADVLSQQQVQEASQKLTNIHSKRPFRFYIVFVKTAVPDASPTEVPSAPSSASPDAAPKPAGQTPEDKKRMLWAYQFTQKNHLDAYDALLVVETDTHQASLYHSPHGPLQNDEAQNYTPSTRQTGCPPSKALYMRESGMQLLPASKLHFRKTACTTALLRHGPPRTRSAPRITRVSGRARARAVSGVPTPVLRRRREVLHKTHQTVQ